MHIDSTDPIYAMCQTGMHAEEKLRASYGRGWRQAEQNEDPRENCEPKGADYDMLPVQQTTLSLMARQQARIGTNKQASLPATKALTLAV